MTSAPEPEDEALRLEEAAVTVIAGPAVQALKDVIARITTLAQTYGQALSSVVQDLLRRAFPPMNDRIAPVAMEAWALGVSLAGPTPPGLTMTPTDLPDLDRALADGIAEALALAQRAAVLTGEDLMTVVGRVGRTAGHLEGEARRITNEQINSGTTDMARALGLNLVWVPERNACLDCLAHAGWVTTPDGLFPAVSFDPRARSVWTVAYPPLHPNCRCRVRTTNDPPGPPLTSAPLAREARRTVVYQWTSHESKAASRRAAEALLRAGAGLAPSVESRARRALKNDQPVRRP